MGEIPTNSKSIFVLITFLFITIGFTWLYIHFSSTIKDEPVEETIELKYSKKDCIYTRVMKSLSPIQIGQAPYLKSNLNRLKQEIRFLDT